MPIRAQLFDGTILEFPDETSPDVVNATAKKVTSEINARNAPQKQQAGFLSSLVRGATELGEAPAATRFALAKTPEEQTKARAELTKPPEEETTSFSDVISGKGKFLDWAKQTAGSSAGALAAPAAAGLATLATPAAPFAPIVSGAVLAGQYLTGALGRQAQEQKRAIEEGRAPEETSVAKAGVAAAGETALDVLGFKFFKPVFKAFPIVGGLFGEGGERLTKSTVNKITDAFEKGAINYKNGVAYGIAKGVAFEMPQEIAQTALERWQAGLSLTNEEARNEYVEAAAGALLLGSTLGGATGGIKTATDRAIAKRVLDNRAIREAQRVAGEEAPTETPVAPTETPVAPTAAPTETAAEEPKFTQPAAVAAVKEAEIRDRAEELLGAGVVATPQEAVRVATEQIRKETVSDESARREAEAAPPITSAGKAATTFEKAQSDLLGHYMPERVAAERPEFALAQPQAPDLRQMALPLEERRIAPEISPAQLQLPLTEQEKENARRGTAAAEPTVTGTTGQPAAGEGVYEPVPQPTPSGTEAADVGRAGVDVAGKPVARLVKGKREERPALNTVGAVAGVGVAPEQAAKIDADEATPEWAEEVTTEEPKADLVPATPEGRKQATQIIKAAGVTEPQEVKDAITSATDDFGNIDLGRIKAAYPPKTGRKKEGRRAGTQFAKEVREAREIRDEEGKVEEETGSIEQEGKEALRSEKGTTVSKADPTFEGFRTAQAALRHIIKTGNPFESLLADRLLRSSIGVRIVVIQPGQTVPDVIKDKFDSARGVYYEVPQTDVRTIYLHGSKSGDALQGVNARTILHEVLHAATAFKLKVGLSRIVPGSNVAQVAAGMQELMDYARAEYAKSGAKAGIPDVAFNDVREFVTYGLTDPRMQEFLVGVKGRKETAFSRFVAYVRQLFNMGPEHQSAMSNLISMTDQLISTKLTTAESRIGKRLGPMKIEAKKVEVLAQKAEKELKEQTTAPEKISLINEISHVKNFEDFKELVSAVVKGTASSLRPTMLGMFNMHELETLMLDNLKDANLPELVKSRVTEDTHKLLETIRKIGGDKNKALASDSELLKRLQNFQSINSRQAGMLMQLAHLSTINEIDPSTTEGREKNKKLANMWAAIGPMGQKLYVELKNNYAAKTARFFDLQRAIIRKAVLSKESEANALDAINKQEAEIAKHGPYFPLMRFGRYWVRIGEKEDKEFYMFDSAVQRNLFLNRKKKQLAGKKSIQAGDSYEGAFKDATSASNVLKDIKNGIDAVVDTNKVSTNEEKQALKNSLKYSMEQMWLMTLPDRSFRKQFMHRGNVPGYSEDGIRSFATMSVRTANQFARMKYGNDALNLLDGIKSGLAYSENRPVMDAYVGEMTRNIRDTISPKDPEDYSNPIAGAIKQFTFLWYLTSPASAIVNFASLPVFAMPVLQTRFKQSAPETWATVMGNAKKVLSLTGIKDKEGKFTAPTMYNSLKGDEKAAFEAALEQDVLQNTATADMAGLRETSVNAGPSRIKAVTNWMSFLFQASERVMREITYMSAYQLAVKDGSSHDAAIRRAIDAVHESLGDFSNTTKARILKNPVAQVAFQFKQFAKFTTFFLVRNGMEALKGETPEIRADARKRLIGAVGMTGLAAGVTGIPLYGAAMAAASIAANMMKGDDEPPVDADMEFRKFLYELTGSKFLTRAVLSGPVSVATDIDLHSRLSLNDLWFRDPKQTVDEEEAARNFLIQMMGPSAGLVLNAARGYKLMNTGNFERGVEAMLPAVLRNLFVAGRYATEGAKTTSGDVLLEPEKISTGDVLWQGIGFSPSRLADLQQANIKTTGMKLNIIQEKTRLMQRLYDELSSGDEADTSKVLEQIANFNRKYPGVAITADAIRESMRARMKAQAESVSGARIPKKLMPFLRPFGEYARPD